MKDKAPDLLGTLETLVSAVRGVRSQMTEEELNRLPALHRMALDNALSDAKKAIGAKVAIDKKVFDACARLKLSPLAVAMSEDLLLVCKAAEGR